MILIKLCQTNFCSHVICSANTFIFIFMVLYDMILKNFGNLAQLLQSFAIPVIYYYLLAHCTHDSE